MTLSAEFSVESSTAIQAHSVAYGTTVDLAALSLSFRTIAWEITSSSKSGTTTPTITLAGTPTGATASFPQVADPGDGLGRSWIVKCTQTDSQGNQAVAYRVVGTVNSQGYVPIAADEENYRSLTHGWCEVINQMLATAGGGGVSAHSGLTGLTTGDDHTQYELAARTLVNYTGAASTAVLTDARKFITTSHGSANTFTIPPNSSVAFATATLLGGVNIGAGSMTVTAGGGVTLNGSSFVVAQNAWWYAKKTNTDTWYVVVVSGSASSSGGLGGDAHKFTFSTTTTDSDPGAGTLRFNNATPASVTQLYVDDADYATTDIQTWLASLDDAIGAIKGRITIQSTSDPTKKIVFTLSAWTTATGYKKLTVAHVFGTVLPTTAAGDTVLSFDALGMGQTIVAADIASDAVTTAKILNDAVTYAKLQNVSAASRVLLRGSASGAGDVEEGTVSGGLSISGTAITIADAALSWAKLATAIGNLGFTGLKHLIYTVVANGNLGATPTIDLTAGTDHTGTLSANATVTLNAPTAGTRFRIKVTQDSTPWTITWPGSVIWIGNQRRLGTGSGEVTYFEGEYNGTNYVMDGDLPSRLAPRGSNNVEIDLYPASDPASASLTSGGGTVVVDFPLVAGKYYTINWRIAVGPAAGQIVFFENDVTHAQLVSGAAVLLKAADVNSQLTLAGVSVAFTVSTTNVRMTLTNSSGTTYKATVQAGAVISALPS